jgi:hypothetical protein
MNGIYGYAGLPVCARGPDKGRQKFFDNPQKMQEGLTGIAEVFLKTVLYIKWYVQKGLCPSGYLGYSFHGGGLLVLVFCRLPSYQIPSPFYIPS